MNRAALGQFYTDRKIGQLIACTFAASTPRTALELGAAKGALIQAVRERWDKIKVISTDIDKATQFCCSMTGRGVENDIWASAFCHLLSLTLAREVLDSLKSVAGSSFDKFNRSDLKAIDFKKLQVIYEHLPSNFDDLDEYHDFCKRRWRGLMSFFDRYKAYKLTKEYQKESFYNKSRLKLILIVFPLLIIFCAIIRKLMGLENYSIYLGAAFLAIIIVNLGADYLTKKKFKDL